ncbi:serine hydrolase domain-containing protein [Paucibacter soli]|uniref:serine hydrolase domain-containing protein n=1 Tax=Paucibacter soli TaxID=3133433 RepID=UPI0030B3B4CF
MKNVRVLERIAIVAYLAALAITGVKAAAQQEKWPTQGWPRSSPEAQGMDSEVLAEAFDEIRRRQIAIHSLTIVRDGYLVLDAYFWPFQDNLMHDMASVTKGVTSTLVGVAIGQHKVSSVAQAMMEILGARATAKLDSRKTRLTVEHLLTMTSGLDCHQQQGEITLTQMRKSPDWIGFMFDLPMVAEPGSVYEYCSGGMHLLSGIITKATGGSALDFARRTLFAPLGIGDAAWPSDSQGISHGWGDLHLQPRDMAKIGYLWLRGGQWEDRQLVPTEWMRAAVQAHAYPGSSTATGYGYGLWIYPDRSPPMFEGLGRGGQRISVVPAKNLVVVFTGGEFEPGDIGQFIGRAIKSDRALPENPAGARRLASVVRAATEPPAARPLTQAPLLAEVISGRAYALDANPFDIRSFSLTFSGSGSAQFELELVDRHDGPRPIGLDGVPRVSPDGRFGLPVAASGAWENDSTFILDYDEVGNINKRRFRLTFANEGASVELTDRSEPLEAVRYRGRAR